MTPRHRSIYELSLDYRGIGNRFLSQRLLEAGTVERSEQNYGGDPAIGVLPWRGCPDFRLRIWAFRIGKKTSSAHDFSKPVLLFERRLNARKTERAEPQTATPPIKYQYCCKSPSGFTAAPEPGGGVDAGGDNITTVDESPSLLQLAQASPASTVKLYLAPGLKSETLYEKVSPGTEATTLPSWNTR